MSTKSVLSSNSRLLRIKALKTRSSRKICDERLACTGLKPYAVFSCKQCDSNQCELCEALLHEDFLLNLHERQVISGPPSDELCEGSCEDRNFADLNCRLCDRNYCLVCDHIVHSHFKQTHIRTKFTNQSDEFLSCDEIPDEFLPFVDEDLLLSAEDSPEFNPDKMMSLSSNLSDTLPDLFPEHEVERKKPKKKTNKEAKSFLLINDKELLQVK